MIKEDLNDLKKFLKSKWVVAFFLMMGSFCYDVILFARNGAFFNTFLYSLILCLYYIGWFFSLHFGRVFTALMLFLNFFVFCVLNEYYQFHSLPLKFPVILSMWQDGLEAGWKNRYWFFDTVFFGCLSVFILQVFVVLKTYFFHFKKMLVFFAITIVSFVFFLTYAVKPIEGVMQLENSKLFLSYHQGLLYKITWIKDIFSKENNKLNEMILKGNKDIRQNAKKDDIFLPFFPKHIYLIQAESLTTTALQNMPFLTSLEEMNNSFFYEDKNHNHCIGSGNTDFMMMSGFQLDCENITTMVYYAYPETIYEQIEPLSKVLQKKGYKTIFAHSYDAQMYQRKKHYKAMGFDKVLFQENFDPTLKRGDWGLGDFTFLKEISKNLDKENAFYFIITSGMHPPYEVFDVEDISEKNQIYSPVSKYLNAALGLDFGIKELYFNAPDDSLFLIYGDHNVPNLKAYDTPFILLYKGEKLLKLNKEKQTGFKETIRFVNSLFE